MVAGVLAGCGDGGGGAGGSVGQGGNRSAGGSQGLGGSGTGGAAGGSGATGGSSAAGGTAGASPSGACGQVEPCGGSLDGVWNVTGACVNNTAFMVALQKALTAGCGLVSVNSAGVIATGSIGFTQATMTYTSNLTETGTFQYSIPMACLNGQTCAGYAAALLQQTNTLSASCSGTTTCACTLTSQEVRNESGTYTTGGTTVTLTSSLGTQSTGPYCVEGTSMHLLDVDASNQTTVIDDSVFTKE